MKGEVFLCTAVTYKTCDHYFGRTFDYERSFGEKVVITPRNYGFVFRKAKALKHHYAMIGAALIVNDYPLYYDATNEQGLSMAGLNFPNNAVYSNEEQGKENVAPFELIPWILGQCTNISEVKTLLRCTQIVDMNFSEQLPATPLHWMVSDSKTSLVIEVMENGMNVYDNPLGVLTNNPRFDQQLFNLNNYISLSIDPPINHWKDALHLSTYSRGMGAIGLPGDLSSVSRFVRAAFTKIHSLSDESEAESVSQFFHILGSVTQQRGLVRLDDNVYEKTIYTSCCNTSQGIYYYKTYDNHHICAVCLFNENLEGQELTVYPFIHEQQIYWQNRPVD